MEQPYEAGWSDFELFARRLLGEERWQRVQDKVRAEYEKELARREHELIYGVPGAAQPTGILNANTKPLNKKALRRRLALR